jgi:very-short-patch-repair endonuclease
MNTTNHKTKIEFDSSGRSNIICDYCGKKVTKNNFEIMKHKAHFCNNQCKYDSQIGKDTWNKGKTNKDDNRISIKTKSLEHRKKISASHIGIVPSEETRKKLSDSAKKKIFTEEHRKNMRNGMIKRIESKKKNKESPTPRIGNKEKRILDLFQDCFNYQIIRQYRVNGYFIDGYCLALNLAIEIDEPIHFVDGVKATQLKEKDKKRQEYLERILGCNFLRIPVGYPG